MKWFLTVIFLFSSTSCYGGFTWLNDWKVEVKKNTAIQNLQISSDLVSIPASYNHNPQINVNSLASREFELNGYNEPVSVTIQTTLRGTMKFLEWGLATGLVGNTGIDGDLQTYERYQILPGTSFVNFTVERDVLLTNGKYVLSGNFASDIRPNIIIPSYIYINTDGWLDFTITKVNNQYIPEPSGFVTIGIGLCALYFAKKKMKRA